MSRTKILSLLAMVWIAAAPAGADWLVTRDGGRVEVKGTWKVKGKLVVFTQADGTLSSLRLSEVDLEASRKATEESKVQAEKPPAPEPPPKKKLAVLTDADFKKATPSPSPQKAENGQPAAPGLVSVSSWQRADQEDGLQITGMLLNNSDDMVVNAAVEVQLYNEAGDRVGTAPALLTTTSVTPSGSVEFRASFPGVYSFSDVRFEAKGMPLDISPAPAEEGPGN
jgi:hypothetical protein